MKYQPHDYQKYAIDWIEEHPVCAVFLDMGLGKTSITLTALQDLLFDRFESHRVLVIAPLRVARDTWKAEAEKWDHLQDLRLSIAVGSADERRAALEADADIYVINRENVPWMVRNGLFDFDTVVIDELSSFKNHTAQRYKALYSQRKKIKRIIGLTGTPSVNGLDDLWAEFRMLDGGKRLGKYVGAFRNAYEVPDKKGYDGMVYSWKPLPGAVNAIREKISDVTISMKSVDHLKMPELISLRTNVYLSPEEIMTCDELAEEYVLPDVGDGAQITAANAAVLSGKLAQLANGAIYDDMHQVQIFHQRKLDALEDLIEAMNGRPVLVAYWFKHDLERITALLERMKVRYSCLDSSQALRDWNEGNLPVGLIHPASAGHGLNLQSGGNHLIWFGLTWSLELYQQTNARLWRQGQQSETVVIQHIVTANSIDVNILDALEKKNMNQEALIQAVKANIRKRK